jgi:hypothetical protein
LQEIFKAKEQKFQSIELKMERSLKEHSKRFRQANTARELKLKRLKDLEKKEYKVADE